ncbi:MAG: insulinase family protein, partial [Candidatus Izimaplasma sp.]|nr:insulinase family protein [Candidatus Izimaplasma bacterium]
KIKEVLYTEILENGLNIYLLPKKGFHKSYATFSTNLGSIATQIKDSKNNIIDLPMGIAHFLEHKLFEQNNQDVSTKFAANQARVNAFTQNNRTTYMFSCTANLEKNIELLLNFVQNPLFTDEGVEKEKGIITQEIRMYQDDPNTVAYMRLLKNLYKDHPVKYDILGTEESIQDINVEILNKAHQTFYNPKNMILFITGNFDPEELIIFIRENQKNTFFKNEYINVDNIPKQNNIIYKKGLKINHEISIPNYLLAIKQLPTNFQKENIMKKELIMAILIDLIIGKSSPNYRHLINDGLINDSFGIDITFEESYGFFLVGSETYSPEELNSTLREIFLNLDSFEIRKTEFDRTKRQIIGGFIQALNSLEYIANQFTKYYYIGSSLFDILNVADKITIDDVNEAKKLLINENSYTFVTVYPKKNDA